MNDSLYSRDGARSAAPLNPYLDLFRALAAIVVLFHHASGLIFKGYVHLENPSLLARGFYFISGLGHEAVVIFFVLSGYLIFGNGSIGKPGWSLTSYAIKRLARLWTVLVPALLLSCIIALLFKEAAVRNDDSFSAVVFLGNLFFFQTILVPCFGGNEPLWSLANEFRYYVIFPLVAIGLSSNQHGLRRCLCLALVFMLICIIPLKLLLGFPVWLFGCTARAWTNYGSPKCLNSKFSRVVGSILFLGSLVLFKAIPILWVRDIATGACFALVLVTFSSGNALGCSNRVLRLLSGFSFSVYLFHFPLLFLALLALGINSPMDFGWVGLLALCISIAIVFLASYLAYLLFEKNTDRVQQVFTRVHKFLVRHTVTRSVSVVLKS